MRYNTAIFAAMLSILSTTSFSQGTPIQMTISTGSAAGAYNPMGNDLIRICELEKQVGVITSGGSIDNHNNIWEKQPPLATSGIFQYDFALYMRERDPRWQQSMAVVARLHDEFIQIIALDRKIEEGGLSIPGVGRIGGTVTILQNFNSLKGRTVYAWGGSFYSANVLSEKFGLGLNVVDLTGTAPDGKGGFVKVEKDAAPQKVAAMLIAQGKGVAVIAVGGANLSWLNEANGYGKAWKLLPVTSDQHTKVAGTYGLGRVSYLNLSGGQVQTLTIPALLMTRRYSTEARTRPIVSIQECIRTKIAVLRDEGSNQSKWAEVDPSKAFAFEGWPMIQLPESVQAPMTPTKKK